MNKPACNTHGPIDSFEARRTYTFTQDDAVKGLQGIVLSCGCEHYGITQRNEEINDNSHRVTLLDFTGAPILSYIRQEEIVS
ncbi:hypothetical protein V6U77_22850 [Micromonospora sp. CPCC 205546]|uniref:hypothetical protein n=1 Tax=Micromonospora sp. CPCC 205546 TaxID=3122397 RepID=UPI002FF2BA46